MNRFGHNNSSCGNTSVNEKLSPTFYFCVGILKELFAQRLLTSNPHKYKTNM